MPPGLNPSTCSIVFSASAQLRWSVLLGSRVSLTGTIPVKTGPNRTITPFSANAGAMKLPTSCWMSGSAAAAMVSRSGSQASFSSRAICEASTPAAPALSTERRLTARWNMRLSNPIPPSGRIQCWNAAPSSPLEKAHPPVRRLSLA